MFYNFQLYLLAWLNITFSLFDHFSFSSSRKPVLGWETINRLQLRPFSGIKDNSLSKQIIQISTFHQKPESMFVCSVQYRIPPFSSTSNISGILSSWQCHVYFSTFLFSLEWTYPESRMADRNLGVFFLFRIFEVSDFTKWSKGFNGNRNWGNKTRGAFLRPASNS